MEVAKFLFYFPILFVFISCSTVTKDNDEKKDSNNSTNHNESKSSQTNTIGTDKIKDLKLIVTIDLTYKQINKENFASIITKDVELDPFLKSAFELVNNGSLPSVFYTKNLKDPLSSNILINQMQEYYEVEENLIPKIKASLNNLENASWKEIKIIETKNNYKGFKLYEFTDNLNPNHKNITYWLVDESNRKWVAFSFNNIEDNEIETIIDSVLFY